ncbi:hypothetical protein [Enterococcus avium]|uniref:hypothetical protein n=1 Tax=Enterococcus avium TaxID=33945 RepID=UPI00163D8EFE|nr:hypothetical protein [Enterococcus avium]
MKLKVMTVCGLSTDQVIVFPVTEAIEEKRGAMLQAIFTLRRKVLTKKSKLEKF